MPAFYVNVSGRVLKTEAPSAYGAAKLLARDLYGNGMTVKPDPLHPDVFFLSHPYPREWRPVVPLFRLHRGRA